VQPRQDRTQRMPCRSSFPVDKPEHGRKWQGRPSLVRLVDSPNAFPRVFLLRGCPGAKFRNFGNFGKKTKARAEYVHEARAQTKYVQVGSCADEIRPGCAPAVYLQRGCTDEHPTHPRQELDFVKACITSKVLLCRLGNAEGRQSSRNLSRCISVHQANAWCLMHASR
jgi:hypothetical protein